MNIWHIIAMKKSRQGIIKVNKWSEVVTWLQFLQSVIDSSILYMILTAYIA